MRLRKLFSAFSLCLFVVAGCGDTDSFSLFSKIESGTLVISPSHPQSKNNHVFFTTDAKVTITTTNTSTPKHVERVKTVLAYFVPPSSPFLLSEEKEIILPVSMPSNFEQCSGGRTGFSACDDKNHLCTCIFQANESKTFELKVHGLLAINQTQLQELCTFADSATLRVYVSFQENNESNQVFQFLSSSNFKTTCN